MLAALLGASTGTAQAPTVGPVTLEQAIQLAEKNQPNLAAALAESRATALERKDAKAALLPSVVFHNQYLYTQSNRTAATTKQGGVSQSLPIFIANNAVHEYVSQGVVTETIGVLGLANIRLANANAARAAAELEITRRGLLSTVVGLFYRVRTSEDRVAVAKTARDEANSFLDIAQKRESAGESAHSDTIKARLGQQQRERDLAEAMLQLEKARIELALLLYPDPMTNFVLADEPAPPVLPDRKDVEAASRTNNPEVRSALAALQAGQAHSLSAWAGLAPDLSLNYTYGIDAPQFASTGPDGSRNLGYAASATVDLPIWDWLTSERKIKEARIRREATRVALTAAQKKLLADLAEFYREAEVAQQELASLDASVTDARESLRLTRLRYVNGESTVLEVVDAQGTLVTAENSRADGLLRYHVALAQLETLTGRL